MGRIRYNFLNFMENNAQKDYFLLYASQLRNTLFFPWFVLGFEWDSTR